MAVISKGIKLSYLLGEESTIATGTWTECTNLQEIPELGGDSDAIEITTLADAAHMYTNGILNYGDSLAFKFLYEAEQYQMLNTFDEVAKGTLWWKVELPDGTSCRFGGAATVKLDGVGVNAALTYTLAIKPDTKMSWSFNTQA